MKNIVLVGGGGHCKAVIDVIEQEGKYNIIGILDLPQNVNKEVLGYKIIGTDDDLENTFSQCDNALITVGHVKSNALRVKLFNKLKEIGYTVPTIVSPLAYVSRHSKVSEGTVIMHHAIINAGAFIGKNCIINTKSLIEHDAIVWDNCHISTAAVINGGVEVQSDTFVGSNSTTKEYIKVNGFIKASGVVK